MGLLDFGTGNYLLSLLMFAIIIEICLLPLSIKQHKNTIKQAALRPKEMAIRKKYAGRNDQATQQKVTMEIQEMYQQEHYSPFAGCLPLLIQLPIILVLYNVVIDPLRYVVGISADAITALQNFANTAVADGGLGLGINTAKGTIELIDRLPGMDLSNFASFAGENGAAYHAEIAGAIQNGLPSFNIFGNFLNLAEKPSINPPNWLLLVPILTFVVYFASMKINRKLSYQPTQPEGGQIGCSNNIMDITMPLMSVFIAFGFPAAIGVYWIFKSILGSLKQFFLVKALPYPVFTEEDYKAAEKEYAGKPSKKVNAKNSIEATRNNPKSLFRMDEEDYDPNVNVPTPEEKNITEKSPAYAAPLKDESDKPMPKKQKKDKKANDAASENEGSEPAENENSDNQ